MYAVDSHIDLIFELSVCVHRYMNTALYNDCVNFRFNRKFGRIKNLWVVSIS